MADPLSTSSTGGTGRETPATKNLVGSVILNTLNAEMDGTWEVPGFTRMTLEARVATGTWGAAVVEVRGSINNVDFEILATLTAESRTKRIDISDHRFIQMRTTTAQVPAGAANFQGYVYTPPF